MFGGKGPDDCHGFFIGCGGIEVHVVEGEGTVQHVEVAVNKAGHQRVATAIHNPRRTTAPFSSFLFTAHKNDAVSLYRYCFCGWVALIGREDVRVGNENISMW